MTSLPPTGLEQPEPPPSAPQRATGAGASARPGGADWPPWIGAAALVAALVAITVVGAIIILAWTGGTGKIPPGALQLTTYLQDIFFIAAAFLFAALVGRASAMDFGLVPTRFWRAVGLATATAVSFYTLSYLWIQAIGVKSKDDVTDLGVDNSTLLLLTGVILLTVLAPLAEEILFRGLIFRSLCNRVGLWPAALITGIVFGGIHATSSPVAFLVPLAILGVGLCLLYQYSGSLYPCIALHAANNTVAVGHLEGWGGLVLPIMIATVLGALGLAMTLARIADGRGAALPAVAT